MLIVVLTIEIIIDLDDLLLDSKPLKSYYLEYCPTFLKKIRMTYYKISL